MTAEERRWHEPPPDIAFAPPPDDVDPDDLRAARGFALALLLSALFWLVIAWWLI